MPRPIPRDREVIIEAVRKERRTYGWQARIARRLGVSRKRVGKAVQSLAGKVQPLTVPSDLEDAVRKDPKTRGWQVRIARRFGVSKQRVWQLAKSLVGKCQTCGGKALRGLTMCKPCGVKIRKRCHKWRVEGS